jgi:hypothetical protein
MIEPLNSPLSDSRQLPVEKVGNWSTAVPPISCTAPKLFSEFARSRERVVTVSADTVLSLAIRAKQAERSPSVA